MTILAWHNDPALKAAAVERMRKHREADEFIRGSYLRSDPDKASGYKGCFHGCLTAEALAVERGVPITHLEDRSTVTLVGWHAEAERIFGIPEDLASLLDDVFEDLETATSSARFAVEVTEAIPVGADLATVDVDDLREEIWGFDRTDEQVIEIVLAAVGATAPAEAVAE